MPVLQVKLFVELASSEVDQVGWRILKADSQEVVEEGRKNLTRGLKVIKPYTPGRDQNVFGQELCISDLLKNEAPSVTALGWTLCW